MKRNCNFERIDCFSNDDCLVNCNQSDRESSSSGNNFKCIQGYCEQTLVNKSINDVDDYRSYPKNYLVRFTMRLNDENQIVFEPIALNTYVAYNNNNNNNDNDNINRIRKIEQNNLTFLNVPFDHYMNVHDENLNDAHLEFINNNQFVKIEITDNLKTTKQYQSITMVINKNLRKYIHYWDTFPLMKLST